MRQFFFSILLLLMTASTLSAQNAYSESPYFIISKDIKLDQFPLLSTEADVTITGPIADVTVTQSYTNNGTQPIEAVYVFPASTRAAVYALEMKVGDRTIIADIKEKQAARKTYETAKAEGKRASLLEQHRPNVFQMNVANIMPGDLIEVSLKYTEFVIPENQIYTFVYPTVVGPRYTGEQAEAWAGMPYTKSKVKPIYTFDIQAELNMPVPIRKVNCSTHKITKSVKGGNAIIKLKDNQQDEGNRDFILNYKLSGDDVSSGIQVYNSDGENFFLCQVEPPSLDCDPIITPREYIFILDVSGSMRGYPLDVSKALMKNLFAGLAKTDMFNVMFFAGSSSMMHPMSVAATPENIKNAFTEFNMQHGGGGTNMLSAINRALAIPKTPKFSRSFVIVTDGYVSVEEKTYQTIDEHLGEANFFAFGIGSSVNRFIIEGIAHVGRGEPFIVTDMKEAKHEANKLKAYIEYPVLTDINIQTRGVDIYDVIPENIPDLMAARPIYFFGKYKDPQFAKITVSGNQGNQVFSETLEFPEYSDTDNTALSYLWAREKIRYLDDFNTLRFDEGRKQEITELGLEYNLLTKYTSFVAVDDIIVNNTGEVKKVKQPLPLPQGVSNSAIGFEMELDEVTTFEGSKVESIEVVTDLTNIVHKVVVEGIIEAWAGKVKSRILIESLGNTITVSINDGKVEISKSGAEFRKLEEELQLQLNALGLLYEVPDFEISVSKR